MASRLGTFRCKCGYTATVTLALSISTTHHPRRVTVISAAPTPSTWQAFSIQHASDMHLKPNPLMVTHDTHYTSYCCDCLDCRSATADPHAPHPPLECLVGNPLLCSPCLQHGGRHRAAVGAATRCSHAGRPRVGKGGEGRQAQAGWGAPSLPQPLLAVGWLGHGGGGRSICGRGNGIGGGCRNGRGSGHYACGIAGV